MPQNLAFEINFGGDIDWVEAPNNNEWNEITIANWYKKEYEVSEEEVFSVKELSLAEQENISITCEEDETMNNLSHFIGGATTKGEPLIVASTNY